MNDCVFTPDYAVPPGETLKEIIEHQNKTKEELVSITGLEYETIEMIIKNIYDGGIIDNSIVKTLELITEVPVHFWLNLEKNYREGVNPPID